LKNKIKTDEELEVQVALGTVDIYNVKISIKLPRENFEQENVKFQDIATYQTAALDHDDAIKRVFKKYWKPIKDIINKSHLVRETLYNANLFIYIECLRGGIGKVKVVTVETLNLIKELNLE